MRHAILVATGIALAFATPVLGKEARCFTTDDGYYDCNFEMLSSDGSFEVTADGYPAFQLVMESEGVASGYGQYEPGGRFVSLPGTYERSREDGACWDNAETGTQICAW